MLQFFVLFVALTRMVAILSVIKKITHIKKVEKCIILESNLKCAKRLLYGYLLFISCKTFFKEIVQTKGRNKNYFGDTIVKIMECIEKYMMESTCKY